MLSLVAEIQIQELDATQLVSRDIYSPDGKNIIGQLPEEEYQQQLKDAEGRAFFGLTVKVGEKHVRIHSAISSPNPDTQREERAHMLSQGLARIGESIYRNFSE